MSDFDPSCRDCRVEHYRAFMVLDAVWVGEAGLPSDDFVLCMPCLEKRLGRSLELSDFTLAPLNWQSRFGLALCPIPTDEEILAERDFPQFIPLWLQWASAERKIFAQTARAAARLYEELNDLFGVGIAEVDDRLRVRHARAKTKETRIRIRRLRDAYWMFLASGPYREWGEAYAPHSCED